MRWLETRVPPPVVTLVFGLLMSVIADATARYSVDSPALRVAGIAVILLGLGLEVAAAMTFRRVCTTVNPLDPTKATSLVTAGLYRYSRNPIYVGDLLLLVGWALYLGSAVSLVALPGFIAYLNRFQIVPEERILEEKFGEAFRQYRQEVRRWV